VTAPYPFGFIGNSIARIFTLAVPSWKVRSLLPAGLDLGDQDLTPEGTHPVLFLFQRFFQCQCSIPLALPSMAFYEHTVCIPYTSVTSGYGPPGGLGPFCFLPKLYLTDPFVMLAGMFVWGYDKELAQINAGENSYSVARPTGERIASLEWQDGGDGAVFARHCREFDPVRRILDQKLISALPVAAGPWLMLTDFERRWNMASVRPLRATLSLTGAHLRAFAPGCYTSVSGDSPAPFEFSAPWYLSFPYSAMYPVPALSRRATDVL
jgi:hypothetical protein